MREMSDIMRDINVCKDSNATVVLSASELISVFKSVLISYTGIDLDELGVYTIIKYSNNRLHITLDTELLRETNPYSYIDMIQNIKKVFSPYIFTVNTAIDVNILINELFSGYDLYRINEDMTIEIYY
jgi:hypothetical protein